MKRFAAALIAALVLVPSAAYAAGYRLPVDGVVTDKFGPPANKYGAGNRGRQFATRPRAPVTAANDWEGTFAGRVGGPLDIVVAHTDGLRTTYSKLGSIM